jgi:hypothetical protein
MAILGLKDLTQRREVAKKDGRVWALLAAWYNFARQHESLGKQTPAMVSQLTDRVWTIKELIERAA